MTLIVYIYQFIYNNRNNRFACWIYQIKDNKREFERLGLCVLYG